MLRPGLGVDEQSEHFVLGSYYNREPVLVCSGEREVAPQSSPGCFIGPGSVEA